MKIWVEHEITNDLISCYCGDSGGEYFVCPYIKNRDKHGKKGVQIQRNKPKCTLFNEWLDTTGVYRHPKKCKKCLDACAKTSEPDK